MQSTATTAAHCKHHLGAYPSQRNFQVDCVKASPTGVNQPLLDYIKSGTVPRYPSCPLWLVWLQIFHEKKMNLKIARVRIIIFIGGHRWKEKGKIARRFTLAHQVHTKGINW